MSTCYADTVEPAIARSIFDYDRYSAKVTAIWRFDCIYKSIWHFFISGQKPVSGMWIFQAEWRTSVQSMSMLKHLEYHSFFHSSFLSFSHYFQITFLNEYLLKSVDIMWSEGCKLKTVLHFQCKQGFYRDGPRSEKYSQCFSIQYSRSVFLF